jgi:hypothetical protein
LALSYGFLKPDSIRVIMQTETWNKLGLSHHTGSK